MRRMYILATASTLLVVLAGCTSSDSQQPGRQPVPSQSSVLPSHTPTPSPTASASTASAKPDGHATSPVTAALSLFYVALGDKGQSGEAIGCGDSLVLVQTSKVTFSDQVQVSFEHLLANHQRSIGQSGLYNALYQSRLAFVSSSRVGNTITVHLRGKLVSGGVCDDPRIINQLQRTATVAAGVGKADILVNNQPVSQLLNGR